MKKYIMIALLSLMALATQAQLILFKAKKVETASDSYCYNALTGRIVQSGNFADFSQPCLSYIEFSHVVKDTTVNLTEYLKDTISGHNYQIKKLTGLGAAVNNQLPYEVMQNLYSQDLATFYVTIYQVGKANTRNGKPFPFEILPLPQQPFLKRAFGVTDAQANVIWTAIQTQLN